MRNKSLMLLLIFLFLQMLIWRQVRAEYRVYQLGIKYDPSKREEIRVLSTLDNLQYVTYYKLTPRQQTRIISHWMCRGRTDQFKKYCSKPIAKAPTRPQPPAQATTTPQGQSPNPPSVKPPVPQQNVPVMIQ